MTGPISLSIATTAGAYVLFKKMPKRLQDMMKKYDVFTDVTASLFTYVFLGGTLTALMAAPLVGLQVSGLLYIAKHPEHFEYLKDIKEALIEGFQWIKNWLTRLGQEYRKNKETREQLGDKYNGYPTKT